ncbi:MAG: S8 family serine peptidase [Anaerolineaceae bacterium]|nr:S8 family serine peptidase [Anaerolineaceae bacterium]
MKRLVILTVLLTLVTAVFSVSTAAAQNRPRKYIVISQSQTTVSSTTLSQISKSGGRVLRNLSNMGLMVVSSSDPNFPASINSALAVAPVMRIKNPKPLMQLGPDFATANRVPGPPNSHDDDPYYDLDWGITAVDAQNAWSQGRRGQGALVAVLDEGVDATHPDLAPNVRADLGTSFAEDCNGGIEPWQPEPGFYFNHGTHVAGIIAAADNGIGTIGVAPKAQIMPVDVLSRCLGYGDDAWILDGMRYAADHGADVINMSLGSGPLNIHGGCDEFGDCYTAKDIKNLMLAYSYAAIYANLRGTTVIAAAGNDGFDFSNPNYIHLPSDAIGILSVSATAPIGWGVNPNTNLDLPAYYSNFGRGHIDFSAPGGTDEYYDTDPTKTCTVAGLTRPCFVFDYVFSDIPGGYSWAAGTSMATPHVAGVAAQYIGAAGGRMSPILVEAALRALADHPNGNRGRDPFYGYGRVDATVIDPRR